MTKTIALMDKVALLDDPQCELLLLRAYTGVSELYFALRTCPPSTFETTQLTFDGALRSLLDRIVTASGPAFSDWQWRLATLPFAFGGLGVYSAGDVRHYAFLASRLQSAGLQTQLLRHAGIVGLGRAFGDHISAWLRVVPISGLGQTMNPKAYRCVLCYKMGVPLFSISTPCSACSRVFTGDIFGDHAVSCAGIVGIKHRHNVVRDTLVDICYRSGISKRTEVNIGLSEGMTGPLDLLMCYFIPGIVVAMFVWLMRLIGSG